MSKRLMKNCIINEAHRSLGICKSDKNIQGYLFHAMKYPRSRSFMVRRIQICASDNLRNQRLAGKGTNLCKKSVLWKHRGSSGYPEFS